MIVFDLDGTLYLHDAADKPDYEDASSLHAKTWGCADSLWLATEYARRGARGAILTARPEHTRAVTEAQVRDAGLPDSWPVIMRSGAWAGWPAYIAYKRDALRLLNARVYVGDLDEDLLATPPGCTFIYAHRWRDLSRSLRASDPTVATSQLQDAASLHGGNSPPPPPQTDAPPTTAAGARLRERPHLDTNAGLPSAIPEPESHRTNGGRA